MNNCIICFKNKNDMIELTCKHEFCFKCLKKGVSTYNLEKCPLCRQEHYHSEVFQVKGNDSKCVVCYTNDVRNYFSICGHACVCDECFSQL